MFVGAVPSCYQRPSITQCGKEEVLTTAYITVTEAVLGSLAFSPGRITKGGTFEC